MERIPHRVFPFIVLVAGCSSNSPRDAGIGPVDLGITTNTFEAGETGTGATSYEGALGSSCIKALLGRYIVRWDGVLVFIHDSSSSHVITEASTGVPLRGAVDVQDGLRYGCAVLSNGAVECWTTDLSGNTNIDGQLGNGTTEQVSVPFQASPVLTDPGTPLSEAIGLASSPFMGTAACAITANGKLWCWGNTGFLMDGIGSQGYARPVTMDGMTPLSSVISAAQDSKRACAIVGRAPNTLWCWGLVLTGYGEPLSMDGPTYPTQVPGPTNPSKVVLANSIHSNSTLCVIDEGHVRCWGDNTAGAVGANIDKATTCILDPTIVVDRDGAPIDGVADIRAGDGRFIALSLDGMTRRWGYNCGNFASPWLQSKVLALGWGGGNVGTTTAGARYLTIDGKYHDNLMSDDVVKIDCSPM